MDKVAFNPANLYHKYVGRQPVLDTAVGGMGGTLAGYLGANVLLNPLVHLIGGVTGADPEKIRRVKQMLKSYGGALGGAAGLAYGASKHMDTGSGLGGFVDSMTDADYWRKNPAAANRVLQKHLKNLRTGKQSIKTPDVLGMIRQTVGIPSSQDIEVMQMQGAEAERLRRKQLLEQARAGLNKQQSLEDPIAGEGHLPMDYAMSIITRDPFLSMGQKVVTGGIMESSGDDPTNTGSIMKSALRFGAAAVPAYLFGRTMSNMMGMPPEKIKAFSNVGGIAAGILNTGIFGE